ncbi:YceI family protein, partial [Larkinella soli]|uniref:YceI family protein n=1 Tax=Larkinella soli TaxID=1770527 RepID=UPI0013E3EAFF
AGLEVAGKLDSREVDVRFDPDNLPNSSIRATAEVASIQTGIDIRNRHLQRSEYLDATHHPYIQVRSTSFRKAGKNRYIGRFDLTIKAITKEVMIPFSWTLLPSATW